MINITLPDNSVKQFEKGVTALEIARSISEGLARNVLGAKVNDEIWEATRPINSDAKLKLLTWNDDEGKAVMWHSSAHLMAEAIEALYPGVKFGIGPNIENGFYYDIDLGDKIISENDFNKIEDKMLQFAREKQKFSRKEVSKDDAIKYFTEKGDDYKLELINELVDGEITFYESGNFIDLCRGPHLPDTRPIKAVKLLNIAGAYWRGDEKRKQLTRIYGISFPKQKELTQYLHLLEEAKKRDHRKIGKELELFTFSPRVGLGLPLWLSKGTELKDRLEGFLKNVLKKRGYELVSSMHIGNVNLYKLSGHYDKFGEDSFQPFSTPVEDEKFMLKPMNCPHHCEIYNFKPHSYKDLPIRMAEFGTVYRYEQSGELHGLTRVRGFTQDDAHIFCSESELEQEIINIIELTQGFYKLFGFEYHIELSTRPKKKIGSEKQWDKAEKALESVLKKKKIKFKLNKGEGVFYGPKIDIKLKDSLGREWQCTTIQVDFNLPERFNITFVNKKGKKSQPIMIHRALLGSLERFIGVLLEHY
ncbi:MAG: threonine--tRNA ligase, partial [Bacteroidales bacterium]|nr:threonine--tRNA ligase [Bacteroidales bacterium]